MSAGGIQMIKFKDVNVKLNKTENCVSSETTTIKVERPKQKKIARKSAKYRDKYVLRSLNS